MGLVQKLGRTVAHDYGHIQRPCRYLAPFDISMYKRALLRCSL